jgi:hypothetical protein
VYDACDGLSEDCGFWVEVVHGEAPLTGGQYIFGEASGCIDPLSNQIAAIGRSGSTAFHASPAGTSVVDDEAATDHVLANHCSDRDGHADELVAGASG